MRSKIKSNPDRAITKIKIKCKYCKEELALKLNSKDIDKWKNGLNTLLAFPELEPEQRNFLSLGMCVNCRADVMGYN